MTTYASAPGTRLGGRYRLEDRIAAGAGWDAWKAIDETLARAVTVFTFAAGFPRIGDVVTAARAASRLTDPRLAQVFDVEDDFDHAYIVMEWAAGDTLGDLLAQGPLEPYRAARMIAEAATALSSAHAAGVAHMCLSPGSVRWSPTGEVKVVGLGIDAALAGIVADEPVRDDTEGLGWLLYAALTGYWPGPEYPALAPAPLAGGEPCSPRQVIAGIPLTLSDITGRAMGLSAAAENPLRTPGELARALLATLPPTPLLAAAPPSWRGQSERTRSEKPARRTQEDSWQRGDQTGTGHWPAGSQSPQGPLPGSGYADTDWPSDGLGYADQPSHGGRRATATRPTPGPVSTLPALLPARLSRGVLIGIGVVVVAAITAFMLWPSGGSLKGQPNPGRSTPLTSVTRLQPVRAQGFDPLTSVSADPTNEESQDAHYAIDGSMRTDWSSQWYASPEFGQLKAGSGLMVDMGRPVRFSSVTVTFNAAQGAQVKLLVGNSSARSKENLDSMTTVASASNPTGTVTFRITSKTTGRYLVVWFTRLPPQPGSSGKYEAQVFNVAIRGASQAH
ncbi:MAG TPA: protein kinase family protein [Streptosporangiaceae bacterium]